MKNQTFTSLLLIVLVIMSACSASKKFDFADAYKFSHHRYQKTEQEKPEPVEEQILSASVSEESPIVKNTVSSVATSANVTPVKTWTKAEKKEIRKEIKEEIKKVRSEIKEIKKENISNSPDMQSKKATQGLDGKVYIGTVIALAGLVLLILGVASPVGSLAVVVGLVFIVWGLIQQGSI
ncbi:MAG: hypothetical protein O2887_13605 [Bacteroidetes bacterium]|nr:hypothetical protein [Bacteroidota bacterium]MDA1121507.1 hypothetical protein [Bacteroidota bacterium]